MEGTKYVCAICQQETTEIVLHDGHKVCESCWAKIRDYANRVEARVERLYSRATRTQREAQEERTRAHNMAGLIPFGQPILIGHHSEGRDRAYRLRIERVYRRAFEKFQKAEELERRADAMDNNRAISSDDPAVVIKLQDKIAKAEAEQAEMVRLNKLVRKVIGKPARMNPVSHHGTVDEINTRFREEKARVEAITGGYVLKAPELAKQANISESLAVKLLTPDFTGRVGIPDYAIKNNGANIRRMKERLEELQARAVLVAISEPVATEEKNGVEIERDLTENRLRLHFPGKPAPKIIAELKSRGFRWSPSNMAWQRQLNQSAEYAAECVLKLLEPAPISEPQPTSGMIANVYHNGKHSRLAVTVADLQELIYRCGWTVVDHIEGLTDEAKAEIERLNALDWIQSNESGREWWDKRLISEVPALTPDI